MSQSLLRHHISFVKTSVPTPRDYKRGQSPLEKPLQPFAPNLLLSKYLSMYRGRVVSIPELSVSPGGSTLYRQYSNCLNLFLKANVQLFQLRKLPSERYKHPISDILFLPGWDGWYWMLELSADGPRDVGAAQSCNLVHFFISKEIQSNN